MEIDRPMSFVPPMEMARMMLTLAVDIERMGTTWGNVQLQHAARRCRDCSHVFTCRQWLGDMHRDPRAYRDFCGNAGIFERYRGDRRRTPR